MVIAEFYISEQIILKNFNKKRDNFSCRMNRIFVLLISYTYVVCSMFSGIFSNNYKIYIKNWFGYVKIFRACIDAHHLTITSNIYVFKIIN